MELGGQQVLLRVDTLPNTDRHRIAIVPTLSRAIVEWTATSRVSPLFSVKEFGTDQIEHESFAGKSDLILLGPVHPFSLMGFEGSVRLWLTLGAFNVVVHSSDSEKAEEVCEWARNASVRFERWHIEDGIIENTATHVPDSEPQNLSEGTLVTLAEIDHLPVELRDCVSEYCALTASTIRRIEQVAPHLTKDILDVHSFVLDAVEGYKGSGAGVYHTLGILTHINAGLSRFAAQTLSGTSPILRTECHFWIHSLLGVGIANLVLHQFTSFVIEKLGKKRIDARLVALAGRPYDGIDLEQQSDPDYWHGDHLEHVEVPEAERDEPIVPVLTYFSARDGFKSNLGTLSAPLTTISSCNSKQWSMLTLTHEISHMIIRGVFTVIYPKIDEQEGRDIIGAYLRKQRQSLLDAIQHSLIGSVIAMHQSWERSNKKTPTTMWNLETVAIVLDDLHNEVEEIMVHVFDFLYFYGQNTDRYIKGIWLSWGVIPNIRNRVQEYVMRSLCAVLVLHLRRDNAEDYARAQVLEALRQLPNEPGSYTLQASEYLGNDAAWPDIKQELLARKGLVKLVRGFLYWEAAAADLLGDDTVIPGESEHEGYPLRVRKIEQAELANPLRFLDVYTDSLQASHINSAWILFSLAFNLRNNIGTHQ